MKCSPLINHKTELVINQSLSTHRSVSSFKLFTGIILLHHIDGQKLLTCINHLTGIIVSYN